MPEGERDALISPTGLRSTVIPAHSSLEPYTTTKKYKSFWTDGLLLVHTGLFIIQPTLFPHLSNIDEEVSHSTYLLSKVKIGKYITSTESGN